MAGVAARDRGRRVELDEIVRAVARVEGVDAARIAGGGAGRRSAELVAARGLACAVARCVTGYGYPAIARGVGLASHSTAIVAARAGFARLDAPDASRLRAALARELGSPSLALPSARDAGGRPVRRADHARMVAAVASQSSGDALSRIVEDVASLGFGVGDGRDQRRDCGRRESIDKFRVRFPGNRDGETVGVSRDS